MKHRTMLGVLGFAIAAAAGCAATAVKSDPESVAFPTGYDKWQRYTTVDRHDVKQVRDIYATPEVVKAVREGRPVPHGAVLVMAIHGAGAKDAAGRLGKDKLANVFVMEKRRGAGATVPEEWRNGDWVYAAFTADGKPNAKANENIKACFTCHKPHESKDFVVSLPVLKAAK
jgi:hypothetical protein